MDTTPEKSLSSACSFTRYVCISILQKLDLEDRIEYFGEHNPDMEKSGFLVGESKIYCESLGVSLSKNNETRSRKSNISLDSSAGTGDGNSGRIRSEHEKESCVGITVDIHADYNDSNSLGAAVDKTPFDSSLLRSASVRVKQVSQEIRRFASLSRRSSNQFKRSRSRAANALKGLRFISKNDHCVVWDDVEKQFKDLTDTTDGSLPRSLFARCIGMREESEEFGELLFNALARRRGIVGDTIDKSQLKDFWDQISDQSFDCRLRTFFDMVDRNADGRITREEVKEIICLSATTNHLTNIKARADEYAALIMEELDPYGCGYILIENLEMLLLHGPSHSVRGDSESLSKMMSQKLKKTYETNPIVRCGRSIKYFLQDNWRRFWVLALWIGAMAGLFAYKYIQYKHRAAYVVMGHCVCMAKGAAETLKLNMALILLPVCRNTITWLRNKTKLSVVVPFDDNINFHMVIALAIAIAVGIHVIFHLACDFPRLLHASSGKYKLMEPYFGPQPSSYWVYIKSVEGVTGIIIVALMAIAFSLATPRLRRSKLKLSKPFDHLTGFNAFWYCHHLFIIVYALLIVHGIYLYLTKEWYKKTTWMYVAVPIIIYISERLIRALRSSVEHVKIIKVVSYPGKVLGLYMSKPHSFRYRSGQYIFVKCSAVSPFEWHPFSITSAPCDDFISVHIRIVGDWTQHLKDKFLEALRSCSNGENGRRTVTASPGDNSTVHLPKIAIDGPYGAPAQDYRSYEVVMLVGLGIGATPMISILKDIAKNTASMDEEENGIDSEQELSPETLHSIQARNAHVIKRAYFYWTTREQGTFDWFKDVMNEVAEIDKRGVIEFHNYCTSVYEAGDARSALIAMLQSLHHAKHGVDVVSGTRIKSYFGKPNWHDVYKHIALHHPHSRVGVFYCGPPPVAKELRHLALDFCHKTSTKFDFHKENF